ncbi:MAG: hypothetical protein HY360_07605 [Verrucomicrobia bacterium]|nr:hypothetical protein [Verrucomicrobiota bacterium]
MGDFRIDCSKWTKENLHVNAFWEVSAVKILELCNRIGDPLPPGELDLSQPKDRIVDALKAIEARTSAGVDAAARAIARNGRAQNISSIELYFLSCRARFARLISLVMTTPIPSEPKEFLPNPHADLATILEWLLIDIWHRVGIHHWLAGSEETIARLKSRPAKTSSPPQAN